MRTALMYRPRPLAGLTRAELSGAFADLGLLVPLEASLIAVNGLNPTSTLLGAGILYIAAGWYFRLPMPVQPLKAFAAIAIAQQLSPDVIAAGALLMSLSMFLLSATGLVDRIYQSVPLAVVRGIQLGLAYLLVKGAWNLFDKPMAPEGAHGWLGAPLDPMPLLLFAGAGLLVLLLLTKRPLLPASMALLVVGAGAGAALGRGSLDELAFGPVGFAPGLPHGDDFIVAAKTLLVAQLPLTIANSVVATADAVKAYFPERAALATPRRLSLSIALGNLWAGIFHGLPVCHGSGGLTAHYRLGARSQVATTVTGIALVGVALAFGSTALMVRSIVPLPFFGLLLLFVGFQHVLLAMKVDRRADLSFVALGGVLAVFFDGNLAYSGLATLAAYWLYHHAPRRAPRLRPA
ncbi:MAG: putative sulfate/molybdate transporter [Dehalococcoidia bacterium]